MSPEINDVHVSQQSMPWKVMREGYYFKLCVFVRLQEHGWYCLRWRRELRFLLTNT